MKPSVAAKDPEGTVYMKVVHMALSLEMTEVDLTASKQTSFRQAVADAAIVTLDKVSIDSISTVSTRRNFEVVLFVCMDVCVCVCVYVDTCIYMYMYIYIYI